MKWPVQFHVHRVSSFAPKVGVLMRHCYAMDMRTVVRLMMRMVGCVNVQVNSTSVITVVDVSVPVSGVMADISALTDPMSGAVSA